MDLIGTTINHRTAPIELREALHLNKSEIAEFIPLLKEKFFYEGFVLSTCNRTEIFGVPLQQSFDVDDLHKELFAFKTVEGIKQEHFYSYFSCGAVKHIMKVAAGIDSLVLGDSQILSQCKEAFGLAADLKFSGTLISRLSDAAVKVGKRVISETLVGEGAVSVSYAAVQLAGKIFSDFPGKRALVIGAGETGELAAVHLRDKLIGRIAISNRTMSRAETLAKKVNGDIVPFGALTDHLPDYDIIVSATSSQDMLISAADIKAAMKKRRGRPVVLLDIAIPRDIDPKAKDLENVYYHDIDSLKIIIDGNMKKREKELPAVNNIIKEEMVTFFGWYNTLDVVPAIRQIRDFFEDIRTDEINKIKHKVHEDDVRKLDEMSKRLIGRLLHNPTIKLRQLAESGTHNQEIITYTSIIKDLFEAIENDPEEPTNGRDLNNMRENH